jgi:hypothetical protein
MAITALPGSGPSTPAPVPHITRWFARFMVVLWAAFWIWFNVATATAENEGRWQHVALAGAAAAMAAVSWVWPRVGGVLMIVAGMIAAWRFHVQPADIALMAVPTVLVGILLLSSER